MSFGRLVFSSSRNDEPTNRPNDQPTKRPNDQTTKPLSVTRFEDLKAWQSARELTRQVYELCRNTRLGRDFGLRDQIQRSAVSVMANIAEGHGRRGDQEFIQYLKTARGSSSETLSHAYVAMDMEMIEKAEFEAVSDLGNL